MAENKQLLKQLNNLRGSKTVIVGMGNEIKADDGAGPRVCKLLEGKISADIIDAGTVPENYIQRIIKKGPENLLVIDAIDFGGTAGAIKIFESEQLNSVVISTHTLSPRIFVDMIRSELDVNVYFIGIQPAQTQLGQSLSNEVSEAANQLAGVLFEIFGPEAK